MWPTEYKVITQPYKGNAHKGIDIRALFGTKIFASISGKVIFVHNNSLYGQHIIVQSGNKELLYAHMAPPIVAVGDIVERGQVIGTSGGTGYITGPHLHFEVWVDGKHTDPLVFLRR